MKSFITGIISKVGKHAFYVLLAALTSHIGFVTALVGGHIPSSVVTLLAGFGISFNAQLFTTAVMTGVANYIEHILTASK
jgi:inner membrane protein involved in colicin E2 resistance